MLSITAMTLTRSIRISIFFFTFQTTQSLKRNLINISYLSLTLSELFIFGFSGNSLKYQSGRVAEAIMRCDWYLCGGPFRRCMLTFMARSLKPFTLTGGKFFILDYDKTKAVKLKWLLETGEKCCKFDVFLFTSNF